MYDSMKNDSQGYGAKLKQYGVGIAGGLGLLASTLFGTGCSSMQTVQQNQVPQTNSATYEQMKKDPALSQNYTNSTANPMSLENALAKVYEARGYQTTPQELDPRDGKVNEQEPTKLDELTENAGKIILPDNVSMKGTTRQASLEETLRGMSGEEINSAADDTSSNPYGGVISFVHPEEIPDNAYIAVPSGKGGLASVAKEAYEKNLKQEIGDNSLKEHSSYRLLQGDKTVAVARVYKTEENEVVPSVTLNLNGCGVNGTHVPQSQIEEIASRNRTASHEMHDKGAMSARGASAAITGGAGAFLSPYLGGTVFAVNLAHGANYNNVISYIGDKTYTPALDSESFLDVVKQGTNNDGVTVLNPVYNSKDKDELAGIMQYNLFPSDGKVVIDKEGLHVSEDNKFMQAVFGDILRLGVAAGIYRIGELSADGGGGDGSTGGGDRNGGPGAEPGGSTGGGSRTGGDGVISR